MNQITQARDISLESLRNQFGLQAISSQNFFDDFFGEGQTALPDLTDLERQQLDRVQQNYLNLVEYGNFSEETVKMVVLSPLLDLAEFYQAPFSLHTEKSVEIVSIDEGLTVRGKIDVLVAKQHFWVLVIESKSTQFDVLSALPQALAYMLNAPNPETPVYGLLVNGREFVFIELKHQPMPTYVRSFALSLERDNELTQILQMLKVIRDRVLNIES